jgi:hypothetical protein
MTAPARKVSEVRPEPEPDYIGLLDLLCVTSRKTWRGLSKTNGEALARYPAAFAKEIRGETYWVRPANFYAIRWGNRPARSKSRRAALGATKEVQERRDRDETQPTSH